MAGECLHGGVVHVCYAAFGQATADRRSFEASCRSMWRLHSSLGLALHRGNLEESASVLKITVQLAVSLSTFASIL